MKTVKFLPIEAVVAEKIGGTTEAVRLRQVVNVTEITQPKVEVSSLEDNWDDENRPVQENQEPITIENEEIREVVVKRPLDQSLADIQRNLDANSNARILKITSSKPVMNCRELSLLDQAGANVPSWYYDLAEEQIVAEDLYARTVYSSEGGEDREVGEFESYDGDSCRFDLL